MLETAGSGQAAGFLSPAMRHGDPWDPGSEVLLLMGMGGTHGLWKFQSEYFQQFCQVPGRRKLVELRNNPHRWDATDAI